MDFPSPIDDFSDDSDEEVGISLAFIEFFEGSVFTSFLFVLDCRGRVEKETRNCKHDVGKTCFDRCLPSVPC
jgi:hypothetical protein